MRHSRFWFGERIFGSGIMCFGQTTSRQVHSGWSECRWSAFAAADATYARVLTFWTCVPACQTKSYSESSYRKWRERGWRERKGDGERRERRECTWYRWWLHPWQKIFLSVRVCMLKLGLIESESNCSLSHSLSLSSYLAFAHAVLALSLERALFLC